MTRAARAIPIVATKLAPPRTVVPSVLPGTLTKIEKGAQGRLLVVQAPAGYGKTTVLAYAARSLRWRTAWYKLDALDQDPMVFAASLVQSIRKRVPGFGTILEERLADIAEVPLSTSEALGILASELASEVDGELHIVLDDYHEAANSAGLNSAIDYLLGSMPDHLHVIVLTRYEPSFQLAKLRLSDDAAELREDDLRLGAEQVTAIIGERAGLSLVHDDVEALLRFTEGWAASVVLASKSLSSHELHALRDALEDPRLRVDVYSYLAEQVLAKESDRVQRFLKSTCCLEYMTPALADDVTDSSHTERFLDYLTAKGLFTLRTEEGNFRYHRLFRDYLRHRVAQDDGPAAFREQQLKAAAALSRTGDFQAAAELYFSIGEPEAAVAVVSSARDGYLEQCPTDTLESWTERTPGRLLESNPWALLLGSHLLLRRGHYDESLRRCGLARELFSSAGDTQGTYRSIAAMEFTWFWRGDFERAEQCCREALKFATSDEERVHTLSSLGSVLSLMARWSESDSAWRDAERLSAGRFPEELLRIRCQKSNAQYLQGRFHAARQSGRAVLRRLGLVSTGSFQAAFLNVLAVVEAYVGEYRLALNHVDDCLSRCERSGYGFLRPAAEDVRGQILLAMGRTADGSATIRAAAEAPELANDDFSRCLCLSHLGTSARRMGDLGEAMNYYDQALAMNRTGPTPYASLTAQSNREYTRLLCDRDLPLVSLRNSRDGATASGLLFVAAKCDFFESVVLAERGECKPALSLLTRAVDAHLMYGHIHFLSQELMAFPELALEFLSSLANAALIAGSLDALARHHDSLPLMLKALTLSEETALGVLKASAQHLNDENWRVLAGRARRHRSPAVRRAAADLSASRFPMDKGLTPDLPELTAREREVLRLIADGLRNADISQRLYLSPGTVKTYVNRIFSKLGVQDRVHAVLYYKDQVGR